MAINWYPLIGKGVGIALWKIIPLFPVSPGFQHLELDICHCPVLEKGTQLVATGIMGSACLFAVIPTLPSVEWR